MPFNYQSLKNITDQAIVDGSIDSVDIADGAVTGTKIQLGNVTSGKLGSGAIDLGSSTTTGTMPINKGGLNQTTLGGAYQALYSDGSNLQFNPHGIQ